MYNINIELKYYIINNEIYRLNDKYSDYKCPSELDQLGNELYCNELLQVFDSNEILDEKMVKEFEKLLAIMNRNQNFKYLNNKIIIGIKKLYGDIIKNKNKMTIEMFTILFGKQVFYIFHKCIEQQFKTGTIEQSLFDKLNNAVLNNIYISDK